jgi:hypothetical protein
MLGVGDVKAPIVHVTLSLGNFIDQKLYFRASSWTYLLQSAVDFPRVSTQCVFFVYEVQF